MKPFLMAFAAALASSNFALADTPVTPAETEKIKAALEVLGCTGGKMEKEASDQGLFRRLSDVERLDWLLTLSANAPHVGAFSGRPPPSCLIRASAN